MVVVLNEIALAGRTTILELGSGISTIVIARLLAERGGTLTSFEHDPRWADTVRSQLELEGLSAVATVEDAPLGPHAHSLDGAPWYPLEAVAALPGTIDLLLVDGPPGYGEGMAMSRYPALPALAGRLARAAIVILDDADRDSEQEIVARWSAEVTGWSFGVDPATGLAVGSRKPTGPERS